MLLWKAGIKEGEGWIPPASQPLRGRARRGHSEEPGYFAASRFAVQSRD